MTEEHGLRSAAIASEAALLRLAIDLGADRVGGPLSPAERAALAVGHTAPPLPALTIESVRTAIRAGDDPLGDAFCRLRSSGQRRLVGAYYTPASLVEPMVAWVLRRRPVRVVDAGCGSGRFAAAVARRTPGTPIVAVDVDPVATIMTRATLAALDVDRVEVVQGDFTRLRLPRIEGRTAYLGNPPYVRHHDLTPDAKAWLVATAARLGHRVPGVALAGLHAYFYVAVATIAAPGDVGCFVTSSEWLDVGYGAVIRALLLDGLGGRAIHVVDPTAAPFADAMTTAAVCCFEVGGPAEDVCLRFVGEPSELHDLDGGRPVSRETLARARRWSPLLRTHADAPEVGETVPLNAIARVHRGVVTGANDFFVVTREDAARFGIARWCRPAITSGHEIVEADSVIRDAPDRKLLVCFPRDVDRRAFPEVDRYLRLGEDRGIPDRYIPSHRRPWWYLGPVTPPPLVVSYMARQAPRFVANPDRLALVNVGHGIYLHQPLSEEAVAALAAALNALRDRFRGAGRTYHGGMEKFEPGEIAVLPVPIVLLPLPVAS